MREIGGYIALDSYAMPLLHDSAIALNSARNCLLYLIQRRDIRKIYLPRFLCSSVANTCRKLDVDIVYYSVDERFMPIIEGKVDDWVYIVNYYGQLNNMQISEIKEKYGNIIVDNVQAYFQMPCDGIDTIYTCRKFFGVPDGAFVYSDVGDDDSIEADYSWSRLDHILGSFEKGAAAFYPKYIESEEKIEKMPLRRMSKLTNNLLRAIDYDNVKKQRTTNFSYLHDIFSEINKLKVVVPDGPYMYPLYVEDGDTIRMKLKNINIFIPMLWPDVLYVCGDNELEYDMAKNILPLPVDQRYDVADMMYLTEAVMKYIV